MEASSSSASGRSETPADHQQMTNESRMRMRSVPTFPTPSEDRVNYTTIAAKVSSRNTQYRPGSAGSLYRIPVHKPLRFKQNAKPTLDTRNPHYEPNQLSTVRIAHHNTSKYSTEARARVDTSDPVPWKHKPRENIDELIEPDGFMLNPRFKRLVQSKTFQSIDELRNKYSNEEHKITAAAQTNNDDSKHNSKETSNTEQQ